ncbi:type 1 glutamine amidotransferase [Ligilactobacillus sp. WILCCON 0076]|uniref:Type 1 glutamine amidotransferase n=1 Tax=Ligilactobacillus ubinensis TaxID=2876789 RepID=A0A9X2FLG0_9LACO|nr:type 1 glutamine amidotransferase [Ligilactobacillus ubinensis]MCP0887786.1 type 1 glutamine amidotransferase [Ligilactobacillus ubinensis]
MRINVIQHAPNEGPGAIADWAHDHGHQMYVYHPVFFDGNLPTAAETDLLVLLGGPMSVNDKDTWILQERALIANMLDLHKPVFGVCFGLQQIAQTIGGEVSAGPKEAGWGMVERQSNIISDIPVALTVFHWHAEQCHFPAYISRDITTLFSSEYTANQGVLIGDNVIGLQFHCETLTDNVREIVINDGKYIKNSEIHQYADEIMAYPIPATNKKILYRLLDFITNK